MSLFYVVLLPDVCCTEEELVDYGETALLCANHANALTDGHRKPVTLSNLCSYVKEKKAGRINELVQEFDVRPLHLSCNEQLSLLY